MVAIKVIDAMPAEDGSSQTDSARESILAASVSHPNVVSRQASAAVLMGVPSTVGSLANVLDSSLCSVVCSPVGAGEPIPATT